MAMTIEQTLLDAAIQNDKRQDKEIGNLQIYVDFLRRENRELRRRLKRIGEAALGDGSNDQRHPETRPPEEQGPNMERERATGGG